MNETEKRIDWEEVKRRLAESHQGLEKALTASDERVAEAYEVRAAQLAARVTRTAANVAALRVLVFSLGAERYGLEFADLVELLPYANCTPLPGAPPELLGVTNIHGEIRSVVDLGRVLQLPENASSASGGYILLVRKQGREVGLKVDRVEQIRGVTDGELSAPGSGASEFSTRFVKAVTPDRLQLLSTEAILAHSIFQGERAS